MQLTEEELWAAIKRAIELQKYEIAHALLDDYIHGYEAYKASKQDLAQANLALD